MKKDHYTTSQMDPSVLVSLHKRKKSLNARTYLPVNISLELLGFIFYFFYGVQPHQGRVLQPTLEEETWITT